jgi:hypothetical protein
MSAFGSGPSNGQFWYGSQVNFPGFLYKKNVGVGGKHPIEKPACDEVNQYEHIPNHRT